MKEINYDVVILGGGTSGCACAYTCAKNNLKTLLIERNNFLGGLMTGGLVIPVMKSSVSDLNCDYYKTLVKCAKKYNAQITYKFNGFSNDGWFNPEVMKIVLEEVLTKKNIKKNLDILFETTISSLEIKNNKIKSAILDCNYKINARHFVDASASGALAKMAKCDFIENNNEIQENTLRFILGNVDIEKFVKFLMSYDKDRNITNTYRNDIDTNNEIHFTTASTWCENQKWAFDELLKKGVEKKLLKNSDRSYFQIFSVAGAPNQVAFNCPRIKNFKNDKYASSCELIKAKKAIYRFYTFAKEMLDGFCGATIINIATITGQREENRLKTKYIYKKEDMFTQKTFKTPVLKADYGIDIHSNKKNAKIYKENLSYELPLEALMSAQIGNLFAIGKLVGADFEAHSALRVQKSCMSMGEGIAKYIAKISKK